MPYYRGHYFQDTPVTMTHAMLRRTNKLSCIQYHFKRENLFLSTNFGLLSLSNVSEMVLWSANVYTFTNKLVIFGIVYDLPLHYAFQPAIVARRRRSL